MKKEILGMLENVLCELSHILLHCLGMQLRQVVWLSSSRESCKNKTGGQRCSDICANTRVLVRCRCTHAAGGFIGEKQQNL